MDPVCVSPQIRRLKPKFQCDGMEDVGPGGDWGCEGGLMNEIRVLITDPTELASCLCLSTP